MGDFRKFCIAFSVALFALHGARMLGLDVIEPRLATLVLPFVGAAIFVAVFGRSKAGAA